MVYVSILLIAILKYSYEMYLMIRVLGISSTKWINIPSSKNVIELITIVLKFVT